MSAGDDDAGPGEVPARAVVGDLLMMTFDDFEPTDVVHDRSGHGRDAHDTQRIAVAGRYGGGVRMVGDADIEVPDTPGLFTGNELTIEAWVKRLVTGEAHAIYSDLEPDSASVVETSFEIGLDDRLLLTTNDGCGTIAPITVTAAEGSEIPADAWAHIAVTWDGEQAAFYRDGEPAGTASLAVTPCENEAPPTIGSRSDSTIGLRGDLDEVKLSSYPKTAAEIRASMAYDPSPLVGACGDQLVEVDECEGDNPCCDATCGVRDDGEDCAADATCGDGVCTVAGGRVTGGLVALYRFDDGAGDTVTDEVAPALDLTIVDPDRVTWSEGALRIDQPTEISAAAAPSKILDACEQAAEVTLEAWLAPPPGSQYGPVLVLGPPDLEEKASLEQRASAYTGFLRTQLFHSLRPPRVDSPPGDAAAGALVHLVVTRAADGERRLFVDGVHRGRNVVGGDFGLWGDEDRLHLASDGRGGSWLGTLHLVAIYCRALTTLEVAQNHTAGVE